MSLQLYNLLTSIVDLNKLITNGRVEYAFVGEPSFNMQYLYTINHETHFMFWEYDLDNEVDPDIMIGMNSAKKTARIIEFKSKTINWLSETNDERFIRYVKEKIKKMK